MSAERWMGMPLTMAPTTMIMVAEAGNVEEGEGWQVMVVGDRVVMKAAVEGNEIEIGVEIEVILEAIGAYTRERGN